MTVHPRLLQLLPVTTALANASDASGIAAIVVDHAMRALDTASAALWLREGSELRLAASTDGSGSGAARKHVEQASVSFPLLHGSADMGALSFTWKTPTTLGAEDVAFVELLTAITAQALERARLVASAASREQLLSVVAHDVRNPLGVAQLKAQLLLRRAPAGNPADPLRKDLDVIQRSTLQIARLITDLLEASTLASGRLALAIVTRPADDIVAEAVKLARPLAEPGGVTLISRAALAGVTVECDRSRIVQVLGNLLDNAVKHAPAGGHVTVEATESREEVTFAVIDDGPGIPPEHREVVFAQWSRGSARKNGDRKSGVGLGLFIARGIVAAHGGRIWIEDASPGTRVAFTLPRVRASR